MNWWTPYLAVKKFFDLVTLSRRCHDMKMVTTSGQRECHKVYLLPLIFLSTLEGGSSASSISRDSSLSWLDEFLTELSLCEDWDISLRRARFHRASRFSALRSVWESRYSILWSTLQLESFILSRHDDTPVCSSDGFVKYSTFEAVFTLISFAPFSPGVSRVCSTTLLNEVLWCEPASTGRMRTVVPSQKSEAEKRLRHLPWSPDPCVRLMWWERIILWVVGTVTVRKKVNCVCSRINVEESSRTMSDTGIAWARYVPQRKLVQCFAL